MSKTPSILNPTEEDIKMLLSAKCHLGSRNCDAHMEGYVFKRRSDGLHIINIGKTWEKIVLAARAIVAVENPADVCLISARAFGQRAAHKFAHYTGCQAIAGRYTPGSFTNYITKSFKEPRLIIVTDPYTDHQAIKESSYVNIPVIALCDVDSPTRYVDLAIPTANKGKYAIGLIYWMLAREVLRLRGTISRSEPWSVMVDMFFYRGPEEAEKEAEAAAALTAAAAALTLAAESGEVPEAEASWDASAGAASEDWATASAVPAASGW